MGKHWSLLHPCLYIDVDTPCLPSSKDGRQLQARAEAQLVFCEAESEQCGVRP